jgi:SulP family sulfate permease
MGEAKAARALPRLGLLRELAGGLSGAVLAVPISVGFGLFAFAPLGEAMQGAGIVSALVSACLVPVVCAALGASTGLIYAPRSLTAFMVGAVALQGVVASRLLAEEMPMESAALAYLCAALAVAGLVQVVAGLARIGAAVKYVPFPVMAGFQNAAAILLFLAQVAPMLGIAKTGPMAEVASWVAKTDAATLAVGVATAALSWHGARIAPRLPPLVLGLAGGTLVHYAFSLAGWTPLGGTVIAASLPMPSLDALAAVPLALARFDAIDLLTLAISGMGIAMVASMDSLLCIRVVEQRTGTRANGNTELLRLGVGNMAAACFAAIPSGVQVGPSIANHAAGGGRGLSIAFAGLLSGVVLFGLQPALALLPRAVVAGLLVVVALQLFDKWTVQAALRLARGRLENRRAMSVELALMALVAFLAIAVHIVLAVIAGVVIAIALFFMRMSRPIVRRSYRCDVVHSRRLRDAAQNATLAAQGGSILVLELEGALFFGSAEHLAQRIEVATRDGVRTVILDLRHVTDVDSTGARILLDLKAPLARRGVTIALAHVTPGTALAATLADVGITEALGRARLFPDADAAIEWAEQSILGDAAEPDAEKPIEELNLFTGLSPSGLQAVRALLERRVYRKGEAIIHEGGSDREMFAIARGRATARVRVGDPGREIRLMTFSAGVAVGELALLDRLGRSASVFADEEVVCWAMRAEDFERLRASDPGTALQVLTNLGREIAHRLRRANRTICELDA